MLVLHEKKDRHFSLADPTHIDNGEPYDSSGGKPGSGNNLLAGKMLQLLVCPLTKRPLKFDRERQELVSMSARLAYPVRGGIPIMLPSEARSLDDEDMKKKL